MSDHITEQQLSKSKNESPILSLQPEILHNNQHCSGPNYQHDVSSDVHNSKPQHSSDLKKSQEPQKPSEISEKNVIVIGSDESEEELQQPQKPSQAQRSTIMFKKEFDPKELLKEYESQIPLLIEKPEKNKRKATNIPKFIIKIFYKEMPVFKTPSHNIRLKVFSKKMDSSITRFHLVQLFGLNPEQPYLDEENALNRDVLRRLLIRNYDNILSNSHIQHKRIYMLFSKKMLLRLNEPRLVGNIEI